MKKYKTFFTTLRINELIDEGHVEPIDLITKKIDDGTVIKYLKEKYERDLSTPIEEKDVLELLQKFTEDIDQSDFGRKFGVFNNGLNLMIIGILESHPDIF